jgi:long-chain fatty acid transport protein
MLNSRFKKITCLPLLIILFVSKAFGGGFENSYMGMKAASMGGAFTGIGSDASTAFYNPGAMSFLEFSQVALGASFQIKSSSYLSPFTGNSDMTNKFSSHIHAYGVGMINEKTAIGISINTPFCLRSVWENDWTGRFVTQETRISATYVQPAFSYMFSESFSVGLGPVIAFGKTVHSRAVPYNSSSGELMEELNGNSTGFGFNIGLFFKPEDHFSMGLSYRSSVKMNVKEGDVSFSNVPLSLVNDFPANTSFSTNYTLPSVE